MVAQIPGTKQALPHQPAGGNHLRIHRGRILLFLPLLFFFHSDLFFACLFLKMDKCVAARMTVVVLGKIPEYDVFALQP